MSMSLDRRILFGMSLLLLLGLTAVMPGPGRAADEDKLPFKVAPATMPETKVTLRSVKPLDAKSGCILVGDEGFIARSEDGGKKWKLIKSGSTANLWDVRFRTTNLGIAVGDGGKYPSPPIKAQGIYVILKDGRYIMDGDHPWSTILRTTDGGKTWKRIEAPTNMTLNGVSWLDDKRVIAVMSDLKADKPHDGCFCTSEDAGLTWKVFYHIGAPCKAITIGPDRTGWVVGFPTVGNTKIILGDGKPKGFNDLTAADKKELTADIIRGLGLPAGINATSFALNAIGAAPLNRDKVVADGLAVEGTAALNHAAMFKDRCWVVGELGYLAYSERKGKKWSEFTKVEVGEKEKVNFNAVAVRDENTALVVGDGGVCIGTVDGGKTWKRLETGTDKALHSVVFVGKEDAVIVGDEGTVLHVGKPDE